MRGLPQRWGPDQQLTGDEVIRHVQELTAAVDIPSASMPRGAAEVHSCTADTNAWTSARVGRAPRAPAPVVDNPAAVTADLTAASRPSP